MKQVNLGLVLTNDLNCWGGRPHGIVCQNWCWK
jgi:hypothetical protein